MQRFCFVLAVLALGVMGAAGPLQADERPIPAQVRFNRDIRPILSDTCFACHGPDEKKREAKLRLDVRDGGAFGKRRHGAVIVPGDPDQSQLIQRVLSKDPDEIMPPPELHKTLSPRTIALLRRWIEQGAPWEGHWVYEPLAAVVPPAKTGHPVDAFIDRGLQSAGLKPLEQADRRTLIRRVSFDLTGLPPTPEQVDTFLADKRPDAYERLVDQLLASPRYGERMAMYWLDLVRYADTIGYHSDNPRNVYLYRSWVIDAFNANMPYDQFTVEQLAGDQLPNATVQQKIASGYNRLLQTTEEGGAQAKEYTAIYAADRVRNVSGVWMGATVGCAQCHDHKYDPYTTRDFYSLAAFFADVKENAVGRREDGMAVPTAEQNQALAKLRDQLKAVEKSLKTPTPESLAAQAKWESERRATAQKGGSVDVAWIADKKIPDAQKQGDWKYIGPKQGPARAALSVGNRADRASCSIS